MQKVSMLVVVLSFAVALGAGYDTTAGEHPASVGKDQKPMTNYALIMYACAVFLVAALLVWMYHSRGFISVVSILAYVGALSSMSMLIRNCYVNQQFKYPQFLTATHFVATAMVGSSVLAYRYMKDGKKVTVPDFEVFLKGLLPVAVAFVLSLGFANNGLLLTNAHFYEMIGSSTPLVTAGLAVMLGRGFDVRLSGPLGMITVAMFIIAFGEIQLSIIGLLFCVGGVFGRAAKSTLQHSLMGGSEWKSMDPIEVAVWTSSTCFVLMAGWSAATEGMKPCREIFAWGPFTAVLYTCIGASILNIAALFVLRELGPVAQQIVGQLKGILSILGAVAAFGESVSMQQIGGYSTLLVGIYWYNTTDMEIKAEKSKNLAKVVADET